MKYTSLFQSKFLQLFTGGVAYGSLEIAWRGYTHISMIILGGICFCILLRLARRKFNFFLKSLAGSVIITVLEFIVGCVVNIWLNLNVWDYSIEPYHLHGQICIRFFLLWWALCALILPVCYLWRSLGQRNMQKKNFIGA